MHLADIYPFFWRDDGYAHGAPPARVRRGARPATGGGFGGGGARMELRASRSARPVLSRCANGE